MAGFDDVRRLSLALPGVAEARHRHEPCFQVKGRTFALAWEDRTILKLDRSHQEFLFEVRPETFQRCPVGTGA